MRLPEKIELTPISLIFVLLILSFCLFAFILAATKKDQLTFFRRGPWGFLIKPKIFKVPIRWGALLFLMSLSLIRKNEKTYVKEALKNEFSYFGYSNEFSLAIGKEPNYYYAVFVGNVVNYFQQIRHNLHLRREEESLAYQGISGVFSIHSDAFDLSSHRLERLEQIRFDFDGWIPEKKLQSFIIKDRERLVHYEKHLDIKKENDFIQKLNELNFTTETLVRDVVKKQTRRFD